MENNLLEQKVIFLSGFAFQSPQTDKLDDALAKAQAEFTSISKNENGFGYKYASLTETIDSVKAILQKNGLSVQQLLGNKDEKPSITTILRHKGQFVGSTCEAPLVEMKGVNDAQRQGAVYSYLRRYALQAILGIGSEDNDASSEGSKKPSSASPKKPETVQSGFRRKKAIKETSEEHDI